MNKINLKDIMYLKGCTPKTIERNNRDSGE